MAALTDTKEETVARKSCVELCIEALYKAVDRRLRFVTGEGRVPALVVGEAVGPRCREGEGARMKEGKVTEAEEVEQIGDDVDAGKFKPSAKWVKRGERHNVSADVKARYYLVPRSASSVVQFGAVFKCWKTNLRTKQGVMWVAGKRLPFQTPWFGV